MHVLVIPSWYKTRKNPVKGSFFEEQARGLQIEGFQVGVLCPLFVSYSSQEKYSITKVVDNGLPTFTLTVKGIIPRNLEINFWYIRRLGYQAFKKYVEIYGKPDILHAHTVYYGGIVAEYISKKTGIPYVITEHYSPFVRGFITNNKKIRVAVKVFKNASQAIAVSRPFRKDLTHILRLQENLFDVIPNLVSPVFFEDKKPINLGDNDTIVFFSNSFLSDVKNHKLMLDAFHIFINYKPNARLVIGGGGILNNELVEYTKKSGLKDHVVFTGLLSRVEVKKQLEKCHIFLSTSTYETFGVVLIEAMAVGRPVITTDSRGPRDTVTDINGRIVKSWRAEDFANEMLFMSQNYSSYDQQQISEECRKRFSEPVVIQQLVKVYNRVLNFKFA
ncbi:MAG TPA: glycosyltransferase [Balneolales bacterium]|nr:glycosyltransferase [Balneolales bacterium]